MVVTVLPSPKGVGFTLVTRIRDPCGLDSLDLSACHVIFALPRPMVMISLSLIPSFHAMAEMSSISAALAISRSLCIEALEHWRVIETTAPLGADKGGFSLPSCYPSSLVGLRLPSWQHHALVAMSVLGWIRS